MSPPQARFLSVFLVLMPLGLWQALGESWNHWATIPATFVISFFLLGYLEAECVVLCSDQRSRGHRIPLSSAVLLVFIYSPPLTSVYS